MEIPGGPFSPRERLVLGLMACWKFALVAILVTLLAWGALSNLFGWQVNH